jgi:hypothetical protein
MKAWHSLLPLRLPEPAEIPDVIESEALPAATQDLLRQVLHWAHPENPGADVIVERAIENVLGLRRTCPGGYAFARVDLLSMFGAENPAGDFEPTVPDFTPACTPHSW